MAAYISIWTGQGGDRDSFNRSLEYQIEGDDFVACEFCRQVGIEDYDPDDLGGHWLPKATSKRSLLFRGTDLISEAVLALPEFPPANCYVLLYGEAVDSPEQFACAGTGFTFLGSFPRPSAA